MGKAVFFADNHSEIRFSIVDLTVLESSVKEFRRKGRGGEWDGIKACSV